MKITASLFILVLVIFPFVISGNDIKTNRADISPLETYSRVKIHTKTAEDLLKLQSNDITVEHYKGKLSEGIELTINQEEIARIKNTGLDYTIEIQDLRSYYLNRKAPAFNEMQRSREILAADNVDGFSFGSMGGFYTYDEVVEKLDSMRIQFPNLISVKQNLGFTEEGREIWAVKLSDNPDINESGSEAPIYFDALHHAREPEAMACLMYYMYWLMENYQTNSEAAYLLNNREIFFVPVANPDGYAYNEFTDPNGGGFWRKNRKPNGSCFGVDLNRNYNYGWGLNSGSSNSPCSETYRGTAAGSELETQAIKNFMAQIHPKIAFSTHSVAGRYLNPYGYNDTAARYEIYSEFASDFAAKNNYTYGTVIEMLAYYSSGTTRDYLHSTGTYCWTPEVGGEDFWPEQSLIIPVASENLYGMKYLSWVGGGYADFMNYKVLGNGSVNRNDTLQLQITVKNRGLSQEVNGASVTVQSLYPNVSPGTLTYSFGSTAIQPRQWANTGSFFKFNITSAANYMDQMKFIIKVEQQGVPTSTDTISINVGRPDVIFSDNAENGISKWTRAGSGIQWDTTFIDPQDGNKNFADSRYGNAKDNTNNSFTLIDTIDLTGAINPRIEFAAKWASEEIFDYTRIQVSTNFGTSWINQPGRHTKIVSGQPSFTGIKHWVNEQINLNTYIGQKIKIRFNFVTDGGIPGDGFYFDNFRVVDYVDSLTSVSSIGTSVPDEFKLFQNYPNPFNPVTKIRFDIPSNVKRQTSNVKMIVYDVMGKEISKLINQQLNAGSYSVEFNAANYPSGIYYYKLDAGDFSEVKKMILLK